ncbi:TetR/AcrR family transcriptional regulator C-terminal domain-containing protein [Streptomyces sp. WAC 04229]|uniref:TetR/AcrR family transcriptional regulator C-terminal domain-containing protein n=1 Tax=Streptomyces sp. WAC 04229 TaxID=2203206 RepID=UPI0037DA58F0
MTQVGRPLVWLWVPGAASALGQEGHERTRLRAASRKVRDLRVPPDGALLRGDSEAGARREAVVTETYPHLAATLPVLTGTDFTARFEFGRRLLLDGLRAARR